MDSMTKLENFSKNLKAKAAAQLMDLDVDRVDLVDKPATGRAFLLFKSEGEVARASEGADALGREYSDAAYASLGGLNIPPTDASPIPDAGAGETWEGTTQNILAKPTSFPTSVGGRLRSKPVTAEYECEEVGEGMKLPGGMRLLSPRGSGIPDKAEFLKPEPTTVLKRETGVFTDAVMAPIEGSNRFDQPQSDAAIKKSGRGLFTSLVCGD